jgi:hypothetical protein
MTTMMEPLLELILPLSPGSWVTLSVPPVMTEREWDLMMTILTAMKPGLVKSEREEEDGTGS